MAAVAPGRPRSSPGGQREITNPVRALADMDRPAAWFVAIVIGVTVPAV
jgi:hypothetical protein